MDKRARFGRVYPIGRDDYTREVTDASAIDEDDDEDGEGTGVLCLLYKDGQVSVSRFVIIHFNRDSISIPRSDRTFVHVRALAERYPRTKFVSIVGDKCIPNLPDARIPMLIVYKKGAIRNQIVGWAADKERTIEGKVLVYSVCAILLKYMY